MNIRLTQSAVRISLTAVLTVLAATLCHAQTGSPGQIEFTGSNAAQGAHVNDFTGGFSFGLTVLRLPGPHGAEYPLTLSYRSGASPEAGASWVGYGWNLFPGAITRNVRGIPDDWQDTVLYWNKLPDNWTVTGTILGNVEIQSEELRGTVLDSVPVGGSHTIRYNNRKGFSKIFALDAEVKGLAMMQYDFSDDGGFSAAVNPRFLANFLSGDQLQSATPLTEALAGAAGLALGEMFNDAVADSREVSYPSTVMHSFTGRSTNYKTSALASIPSFILGPEGGIKGNVTQQTSIPKVELRELGQMYLSEAAERDVMDYSNEKNFDFKTRDVFLPIPFRNTDDFVVHGGPVGGTMRLVNTGIGVFRPNSTEGFISIEQKGSEITGGLRVGIGADFGVGFTHFISGGWTGSGAPWFSQTNRDNLLFRFYGDMGGGLLASDEDNAERVEVVDPLLLAVPGIENFDIPSSIFQEINEGGISGRSVYVDFNTHEEMLDSTDQGIFFRSYTKDSVTRNMLLRNGEHMLKSLGEIAIVGPNGSRYVYGLPVYTRHEKNLSFGLGSLASDIPDRVRANSLVYHPMIADSAWVVVGRERKKPVASAFLLTAITTPDYVDLTNNGPTPDDFGGYVKFNYRRAGTRTAPDKQQDGTIWYRWRNPYNGLLYSRGSLSETEDDFGSVSTGSKEIYYLESVQTKTHIALFVTNRCNDTLTSGQISGIPDSSERRDGYQPIAQNGHNSPSNEIMLSSDSTASCGSYDGQGTPGLNILEKLERIELYTLDEYGGPDSLLGITHFEYDYSIRKNHQASLPLNDTATERDGMLTLRRVWFQNQSVVPARISPFEFSYTYPTENDYAGLSNDAKTKYADIIRFGDSLSADEQNPDFNRFQIDRWGNYQRNGEERLHRMIPWVSQVSDTSFDPAAWQLKRIRMPSGGEVHIQYEQNDYAYVQDQPALAMVSLLDSVRTGSSYKSFDDEANNKYYINIGDLGIADTDITEINQFKSLLQRQFVDSTDRMYFRFLYALKGDSAQLENPEFHSEYLDGYINVDEVGVEEIEAGPTPRYALYVRLKARLGDIDVPKEVCYDLVDKTKRGRLTPGGAISHESGDVGMIGAVLFGPGSAGFNKANHCQAVDYKNSYLRVPLTRPKKGGGVRVKRLLSYDPGVSGDGMLYGTEYLYQTTDPATGRSITSGVAVNEPADGATENALRRPIILPGKPDATRVLIFGRDKQQLEGPLGESLLPAASIGYSRVVARHIHAGNSHPGFAVKEFHTARDFPFTGYYPGLGASVDFTEMEQDVDRSPSVLDYVNSPVKVRWNNIQATQGYRFITNGMHGRLKDARTYGGAFDEPGTWKLSTLQQVAYFMPGENIPIAKSHGTAVTYANPGKEIDVVMESRQATDRTVDVKLEADISMSFPALADFQSSGSFSGGIQSRELKTHVTTKVIHYPAIPREVISYSEGLYQRSENVAFDPATGAPLITRTTDGYDSLALLLSATQPHRGAYHSYGFPAYREYPELEQKAAYPKSLYYSGNGLTIEKIGDSLLLFSGPSSVKPSVTKAFAPGDLLRVYNPWWDMDGFFHVTGLGVDTLRISKVSSAFSAYNGGIGSVDIEIIRRGRGNRLNVGVGSVTTYGENPEDVLAGTNVQYADSVEAARRLKLIDLLNDALTEGGGAIAPAQFSDVDLSSACTPPDTCCALNRTLLVRKDDNQVVLMQADISINDSILGSPAQPHELVHRLNALLDTLWSFQIDPAHPVYETGEGNGFRYRRYDSMPDGYMTIREQFLDSTTGWINDIKSAVPTDMFLRFGLMDGLRDAFKISAGPIEASGVLQLIDASGTDTLHVALYGKNDLNDSLENIAFRYNYRAGVNTLDSLTVHSPPASTDVQGYFPFTSTIGEFGQDAQGYLTYEDKFTGASPVRIFGLRFFARDTVVTQLYAADTLLNDDGTGQFALDGRGRPIFYPTASAEGFGAPQPLVNLAFCPEEANLRKTMRGVIAAGARVLDDRLHTGYYSGAPSQGTRNDYEYGVRGRWVPRSSYTYRTGVVGGASLAERVYRDAGTFEDFNLFDWQEPELNTAANWMRLDTLRIFNQHVTPMESEDLQGFRSSVRMDYDNTLPVMAAYNARYVSTDFESFETGTFGSAVAGTAHAGKHSYRMVGSISSIPLAWAWVDSAAAANGMLVNFWVKTSVAEPKNSSNPNDPFFTAAVGASNIPMDSTYQVARVGEWTLYEVPLTESLSPGWMSVAFDSHLGNDTTLWIDDLRVGPIESAMTCYVYDPDTRRLVAAFDDRHFGAFTQYNAEGRPVRTIVETERGRKTIAEAYGNAPKKYRVVEGGGGVETLPLVPGPTSFTAGDMQARAGLAGGTGVDPASAGNQFEIGRFELGLNSRTLTVFGRDPEEIATLLESPLLSDVPLPDAEKLELLGKLDHLLERREELRRKLELISKHADEATGEIHTAELESDSLNIDVRTRDGIAQTSKDALEAELRELQTRRRALLQRLGITEEQANQLRNENMK